MHNQACLPAQRGGPRALRLPFVLLCAEQERRRQRERCAHLQTQGCETEGLEVWEAARALWLAIPLPFRLAIALPSPHVFDAILGLMRTLATLKNDPVLVLELSAHELAQRLGYSRSTIQAALRWLCEEPIHVWNVYVSDALGVLQREKRFAMGKYGERIALACRTSALRVSMEGKVLLRLLHGDAPPCERRKSRRQGKSKQAQACKRWRQKITRLPQLPSQDETDGAAEHHLQLCNLRPTTDSPDAIGHVMAQLEFTLQAARFTKPNVHALALPTETEWAWFKPRQRACFEPLFAALSPEQQRQLPQHFARAHERDALRRPSV